jgi:hypothetical protein
MPALWATHGSIFGAFMLFTPFVLAVAKHCKKAL